MSFFAQAGLESVELLEELALQEVLQFEEELELYPSAYQPPPFNWNELTEISFFKVPLQLGQVLIGLSDKLCHASITSLHDSHWYS